MKKLLIIAIFALVACKKENVSKSSSTNCYVCDQVDIGCMTEDEFRSSTFYDYTGAAYPKSACHKKP